MIKFDFDEDNFDDFISDRIKKNKIEALAKNLSLMISDFMKRKRSSNRSWIDDKLTEIQNDHNSELDYFYNENSEIYLSYPYSINDSIYAKQICFSDEANECRFLYDGPKPYSFLSIDDAQYPENLIDGLKEWKKQYPKGDELKFLKSMKSLLEKFIKYID